MIYIAHRTLRAIDDAIHADQGNAYRMWLGRILPHMGDAYRQDKDLFRSHMGASSIGRECAREIWYSFNWATGRKAEPRMLRLWNRGHLEEARFMAALLGIGCEVVQQDEHGRQFKISEFGGHYGGSGDGKVAGLPDIGPMFALSEYKTHNDKSFKKLAGSNWDEYYSHHVLGKPVAVGKKVPVFEGAGLREAKPDHYTQMNQYMRGMGMPVGMYFAANKNDDHIYAEVIPYDNDNGERYTQRAIQLVPMRTPPDRISKSPAWYACKFCDHKGVCHEGKAPERNCRTCTYSYPKEDGTWRCRHPVCKGLTETGEDLALSKEEQLQGCAHWDKNKAAFG